MTYCRKSLFYKMCPLVSDSKPAEKDHIDNTGLYEQVTKHRKTFTIFHPPLQAFAYLRLLKKLQVPRPYKLCLCTYPSLDLCPWHAQKNNCLELLFLLTGCRRFMTCRVLVVYSVLSSPSSSRLRPLLVPPSSDSAPESPQLDEYAEEVVSSVWIRSSHSSELTAAWNIHKVKRL